MALSPNDKRAALAVAAVAVFSAAVLGVVLYQRYARPLVGEDNCVYADRALRSRAPADQTVLLVDQSEPLTDGHVRGVLRFVESYVRDEEWAPTGARFLLFSFSQDDFPERGRGAPGFRPIVDVCKPKQEGSQLSENERRIRQRFEARFFEPLSQALKRELAKGAGQRSPILETLQFVSRSQEIAAWDRRKTLIIVSDMLQHTQGFSHYRAPSGYEEFAKRYAAQVAADFRGWDVLILYLRRYHDRQVQQAPHLEFWQRYFAERGARLRRVEGFD